jgi:hypothetical protein
LSFRGNESASNGWIGIEEIEGLKKVSSIQSAKDSLKGMADRGKNRRVEIPSLRTHKEEARQARH